MIYCEDKNKKKLYEGLVKHYPHVPPFIVLRTVELASTPGIAFDAIYDFKLKMMPVTWDFEKEKWKTHEFRKI
jgi:hypothetical protein